MEISKHFKTIIKPDIIIKKNAISLRYGISNNKPLNERFVNNYFYEVGLIF